MLSRSLTLREGGRSPLATVLFLVTFVVLVVLVGLPVLAIVLYALFPNINELSVAAPFSALLPALSDSRLTGATLNSLALASSVTVLASLVAVPLAFLRGRLPSVQGKVWDALFLVPFLIPPYIGSLAWMQLLQVNGFLEQAAGINLAGFLYSFPGIVSVMALHLFPLIYFSTSTAFAVIGTRYGDVAKVFGGRPLPVFLRIHLPMIVPAWVSSGLIVFVLTIEEFGTPEILGSRFGFEVIVTAIHEKFSDWPIDLPGASVLSLLLILIAFVAYGLHRRVLARSKATIDAHAVAARPLPLSWPAALATNLPFAVVAIIAVVLPLVSVTLGAMMTTLSGGLRWSNLGLHPIVALFEGGSDALAAITTSLTLAALAAVLTVVIALAVAFIVVRMRARGTVVLDFLSILPNAIPGMAVAVGLILTWNQAAWPVTPYNTPVILLLAYLCLTLPYPIRMISAALRQLPRSLDDAAYISGAGEAMVILRILAPLLAPTALASGFIVFAVSTRELVSSIMLAPPGVETVATFVFHQFDQGSVNAGMAMSLVTIVVSGGIIALGQGMSGRIR